MLRDKPRYDYESLKRLAADQGCTVQSLLAMAPANDPLYSGTPANWTMAEWFKYEVWDAAGYTSGVHLRRAHYWAVSKRIKLWNGDTYQNTEQDWKRLTQASKQARYLRLVRIPDVIDNKNPDTIRNSYYYGTGTAFEPKVNWRPTATIFGPHRATIQPYHLEMFVEKGTMNDILEPLCREHNCDLSTFQGEASITAVYNLVERIREADRDTIVFYISDFDPAGKSMPVAVARKLEHQLMEFGVSNRVFVRSLALNEDQVAEYKLPRVPIKKSEARAGKFQEAFGVGAVELDALAALHPGALQTIVRGAFSDYFDAAAQREYNRMYSDVQKRVEADIDVIMDRYKDEFANIESGFNELRAKDTELATPEDGWTEEAGYDDTWLFDSNREYREQLQHYFKHKGRNNEPYDQHGGAADVWEARITDEDD